MGLQCIGHLRLHLLEACAQRSAFRKKHHHAQPLQIPVALHRQVIDLAFVVRLLLNPFEKFILGTLRERLRSSRYRLGELGNEGRVVRILDNLFHDTRYVC